ncbi:amino acid adenylation domain-containing protein [Flavobacterium sp. '19STA2R22 D10 B1']|uniref:amino acid adenylation domain-containing protein n=1 Tax=Flavobacterium aerium TaxID=3037261 RepID=UPI00278C40C6|nr:amino acid adenylation domain-containing protein [Flavobacterium sp. '19STA2R22 D10 B1']
MYSLDKTIVDLFLEQVIKTPNQIAIQFEGKSLTYRELNEESNRFSNYLLPLYDIEAEDIIGVQLQRSELYIIVILAIFKVNGCCSPIDIKTPQERLQVIKKNTKIIIDQNHINTFLEKSSTFSTIYTSRKSSQLAYIVYTSGSTGIPKGCMIEHRGIINHLLSKIELLDLNENTRICHTSKLNFVGGLWQLWGPLLTGGTVMLTTLEELQDISLLLDKTIANNVKILELIPSQLNNVFATGNESKLAHLEKLILTGERLTPNYVNKFFDLNPSIEIINTYGQSECSDVTAYFRIQEKIAQSKVLIGKPVQNTDIYICNEEGELCQIDEIGELCISGIQVCRGYLNQPELTAQTFITNPFKANTTLYKTGDLGKYLIDGNIEILGRIDNQVKIRGYRIDLGEIENAILHHKEIENTVVLAVKKEDSEENTIFAYFKSKNKQKANSLREFLAHYLTDYMIPTIFIQVEEFKLTSNGKIDKKVLPDPFVNQLESGIDYIAPQDDIEKQVVEIWKKTLQQESIGMADDFIALGGHSLKMNLLIIRYKKEFDVQFSLGELFENTSLASHTKLIKSKDRHTASMIEILPKAASYMLSDAQQNLFLLTELDGDSIHYDTVYFDDIDEIESIELFKKAIEATIQRHEILRTVFRKNETGKISQFIISKISDEYELNVIDLSNRSTAIHDMNTYLNGYLQNYFDFEKGPLIQTCLFQLPNKKYKFFFRMHQMVGDANSLKVFHTDVMTTYVAYMANMQPILPELEIQYKEYAYWHSSQRYEEEFSKSKSFWMNQLSGKLSLINLPTTKIRPLVKTYNGKLLKMRINEELSNELKAFCEKNNGTVFIGILAVINILFQKYTLQKDIIIATRSLGRYRPELEHQIGNYLNTIVLRNTIEEENNFNTIFQQVRKNNILSFDHQNYYFDWLIEDLDIQTISNRNPIYDIMITYENMTNDSPTYIKENLLVDEVTDEGESVPKLDILFTAELYKDFLQMELQFNIDVYDEKSMTNVLKDFKRLMVELLKNPNKEISTIDFKEEIKTDLKSKNISRLKAFKM